MALDDTIRLKPSRPPISRLDKARAIFEANTEEALAYGVVTDLVYAELERRRTGTC